jgi:HAD superfamily hydrolase (TIGR01509 family)
MARASRLKIRTNTCHFFTMFLSKMKVASLLAASLAVGGVSSFTTTSSRMQVPGRASSTLYAASDDTFALLFDCDGVIIETEELHRLAYNAAFKEFNLQIGDEPVEWTVEYYDVLQNTVGGGKNKMFFHFRETKGAFPTSEDGKAAPSTPDEEQDLVDRLQARKTDLYKELIAEKAMARPGVLELMDQALADPTIKVGVCSASTKAAVTKVLDVTLGEERRKKLDVCILGDDVAKLKPDPLIYSTAAERLQIDPSKCVVIEDSIVGLKAAKGAGMRCVITYTTSTEREDFYGLGADAKVPELGSRGVSLDMIFGPMKTQLDAEILVGVKD